MAYDCYYHGYGVIMVLGECSSCIAEDRMWFCPVHQCYHRKNPEDEIRYCT